MAGPLSNEKRIEHNKARQETVNQDYADKRIEALWKLLQNTVNNEEIYPTKFFHSYRGQSLSTETIQLEFGLYKIKIEFEKSN
jgi:hypothetical protein